MAHPKGSRRVRILHGCALLCCLCFFLSGSSIDIPPLSPPAAVDVTSQLLPVPAIQSNGNITAVIMNHARPKNLQESSLLPTLIANPYISQVLLLHSNPTTVFHYNHPKVKNLNATLENAQMGLSLRFWFAGHHRTTKDSQWVLIVDDDMLVPPSTLQALIQEYALNPHRIVGCFGRALSSLAQPFTNGYIATNTHGATEVVLTKLMLMERTMAQQFHVYAPLMEQHIQQTSTPHWNGEDIFMSLVANHVYANSPQYPPETRQRARVGRNNYAMPWLEVGDTDSSSNNNAVSGNLRDMPTLQELMDPTWYVKLYKALHHLRYRGALWNQAKQTLQQEGLRTMQS